MQAPKDEAQCCQICEKPTTGEYTFGRETLSLCDACREARKLRDEDDDKLGRVIDLRRSGQYDEALAYLDAISESNRDGEKSRYLARNVAGYRGMILSELGRYTQAEDAYKALGELGFADSWERGEYALGLARTLETVGRDREALAVFEDALAAEDPEDLNAAPSLLAELARLSEKLGQPVDPKWRRLAEAVADEYAVEMPTNDSFGQALLTLEQLTRSAKPKRQREWEAEHGADSDEKDE
ncbi:MAG: hypothetical protein R3B70_44420 [Polyangiaceae bacterium]